MRPYRFAPVILLAAACAWGQDPPEPKVSGRALATAGQIIVGAGMVSMILGPVFERPSVFSGGHAQVHAGLFLLGLGAEGINQSAERINRDYDAKYRGWIWYWAGLGLGAVAEGVLWHGLSMREAADDAAEREEARERLNQGIGLLAVAGIAGAAAWVKFVRLAKEGNAAIDTRKTALDLRPGLRLGRAGCEGGSLTLAYRF